LSRKKQFLKGISSVFLQKILVRIIGVVITPIILYYLSPQEYGIWILINSFLGYMGLLDFGITGAVTTIIAKNDNDYTNHKYLLTIINNAFFLQLFIALFIMIIGFCFSFYFPKFFKIDKPELSKIAIIVFNIAIISYGISFPLKALKGFLKGKQYIALVVWLEFIFFITTTLLNLFLLYEGWGLLSLSISSLIVRIISFFIIYFFIKKIFNYFNLNIKLINRESLKDIFNVSIYWFIGMIAAVIIYSTDNIVIGSILSVSFVTIYALSYRLTEVIREFIYSINFTLMPGIGQLLGEKKIDRVKEIYLETQSFILVLALLSSLFIFLFNKDFITLWVGEKFYGGEKLTLIFSLILFSSIIFHSSSIILSAALKVKVVSFLRILEALINIILSIILIKYLNLIGVSLATFLSSLLTAFLIPYYAMKYLDISFNEYYMRVILKIFPIYLFLFILVFILKNNDFNVIIRLIIFIVSSILSIFYILKKEYKVKLLNILQRK